MSVVFFDFDGTLTKRDTVLPLGMFLARDGSNEVGKTSQLLRRWVMLKFRLMTNHAFKEKFCELLLKNKSEERISKDAATFVNDYISGILRAQIVQEMENHIRKGDEVYLVSSNFGFLLRTVQQSWKLRGVIATEAEVESGRFTGRILGRTCEGKEKVVRAIECLGAETVRASTAYGDSRGDRELLNFVKNGIWV